MKLRKFIADALMEIHYGVQEAIERRDEARLAGRISPAFMDQADAQIDWTKLVEKVEFDLAVTDVRSKQGNVGGGLEILSIAKFNAKGAIKDEKSAVNRIRFNVPILLPVQVTKATGF